MMVMGFGGADSIQNINFSTVQNNSPEDMPIILELLESICETNSEKQMDSKPHGVITIPLPTGEEQPKYQENLPWKKHLIG